MENLMMNITRVLVINGSYRDDGFTDRAIEAAVEALNEVGAETEIVNLRDYPIEFCLNCRECTQQQGSSPGKCVIDDGMHDLIDKIEESQAYILASPTNFGSVTALFKRFMERLVAYAYWPWGKPWPKSRRPGAARKRAMLITSSAAPSWVGCWLYGTGKQLETAAKTIGAKSVGMLFTGNAATEHQQGLPSSTRTRAKALAQKLIAA